jgi:hypothetical protein
VIHERRIVIEVYEYKGDGSLHDECNLESSIPRAVKNCQPNPVSRVHRQQNKRARIYMWTNILCVSVG